MSSYTTLRSQDTQSDYHRDLRTLGPAEAARLAQARAASPSRPATATPPTAQTTIDESWARSIQRVTGALRPS